VQRADRDGVRRLTVHTRLQISIAQPETFGFTWIFVIRTDKDPNAIKACLAPGSLTKTAKSC